MSTLIPSFNCPPSMFPYPGNMVANVKLPIIAPHMRPGGSAWEEMSIDADHEAFRPDTRIRDAVFSKYVGWNYHNSYVWVLIKLLTEDLTRDASLQLPLPLMNHYVGSIRSELIAKYKLLDKINTLEELYNSSFSGSFFKVASNIAWMYNAFVRNRVSISYIELGNEHYSDQGQDALNYTGNYDRLIWCRTNNTTLSLNVFNSLCAFYTRLLKYFDPRLKFLMPVAEDLDGGFKQWNRFFLPQTYIDGFAIHPYLKPQAGSDPSTIYRNALFARISFYNNFKKTWLPAIGNRLITFSEFSASEYNPKIRGTDYDGMLLTDELELMQTIPNIATCHYHAYSTNTTPSSMAFKMNGATKDGQAMLNPVGKAFLSLQQ